MGTKAQITQGRIIKLFPFCNTVKNGYGTCLGKTICICGQKTTNSALWNFTASLSLKKKNAFSSESSISFSPLIVCSIIEKNNSKLPNKQKGHYKLQEPPIPKGTCFYLLVPVF